VKTGRLKLHRGQNWKEKGKWENKKNLCWAFNNMASYYENVPEVGRVQRLGRRKHKRQADFYILVCLPREPKPDYEPMGFFVIPAEEVGTSKTVKVFPEDFSWEKGRSKKYFKYRNRWDLLKDH
jgi:hypothetical protein